MTTAAMRGAGLLVAVFAAGLFAGVALDRSRARATPPNPRLTLRLPDVLDQLGLTVDQRRAADSILDRSSPRTEAVMREMVPRLAAIADSANDELRRMLTPAQRRRFDALTRGPTFLLKHRDSSGTARVDTIRQRSRED